ncbi:Mu transposase C-terminal domain-containing protein [Aurantimonas coralicida]|uniref:Mu transposase C-terminal domain-containing protein n=1 Tax=Aurantimonas coralicida TaxID=182270 RepID=UPI001E503798|nr:Mu transposase C-terminal domain-containing protein [Aurantimonas coralicida]MCD1642395.1 Mu transposase C-terminal domain-containing protein [Aurantimonas coralicida]
MNIHVNPDNDRQASRRKKLRFQRHDRVTIDGVHYRPVAKERGVHKLQLISDGLIVEDHFVLKSDDELHALFSKGRARFAPGHFSQVLTELRFRNERDIDSLLDLREDQLRTVIWKHQWVQRFLAAEHDVRRPVRLSRVDADVETFIEGEKDSIHRWYQQRFGEPRRLGRKRQGHERKPFDYPSPSTLRSWMNTFQGKGYSISAFRPRYENCGGRTDQMADEVRDALQHWLKRYMSRERPDMQHIVEGIEMDLGALNVERRANDESLLSIHPSTVRRHINALDPFECDAARYGYQYALHKWAGIAKGMVTTRPFERIEMDDWEVDLQALLASNRHFHALSKKEKDAIQRVRCTITIAIDCFTRMIVGWNIAASAPSTATAKAALKSIMKDKTPAARLFGAMSDWSIAAPPETVVTDGGPAFGADFEMAANLVVTGRTLPTQDPRQRGTIEAFFRYFKRICNRFTGRTFSNVVEKADYPSEALASLTVEALTKAVAVFICDIYHNRPHAGLNGMTPRSVMVRFLDEDLDGLPPCVPDEQISVAFGIPFEATVTDEGVRVCGLQFQSEDLMRLHPKTRTVKGKAKAKVRVVVDQDDVRRVLVQIPREVRKAGSFGDSTFLTANLKNLDDRGLPIPLHHAMELDERYRQLSEKADEKGEAFRLHGHRQLLSIAEEAAAAAGIPSGFATSSDLARVHKSLKFMQRAAIGTVRHSDTTVRVGPDTFGETIVHSARTGGHGPRDATGKSQLISGPERLPPPEKGASLGEMPSASESRTASGKALSSKSETPPAPEPEPRGGFNMNSYRRRKR